MTNIQRRPVEASFFFLETYLSLNGETVILVVLVTRLASAHTKHLFHAPLAAQPLHSNRARIFLCILASFASSRLNT